MAQVTTYPLPCRYPLPLVPAPSTRAMSRATEGFSASTATLPDSAATIVLLQSGIRLRLVHDGAGFSPMPLSFGCHSNSAQIVGQPILAAAGVQPALPGNEVAHGPKEPPKRRLRARLAAPQFLPDSQPRENQVALGFSLPNPCPARTSPRCAPKCFAIMGSRALRR